MLFSLSHIHVFLSLETVSNWEPITLRGPQSGRMSLGRIIDGDWSRRSPFKPKLRPQEVRDRVRACIVNLPVAD